MSDRGYMMKQKKIGYTTGVFDMFHIGHLNILKRARSLCDYLIVGVSTDDLVETYKKKRPIIPFEERMEIVKAIRYVDEVIPQTTMDKRQAWDNIHFDILFHGSDWKGSRMYDQIIKDLEEVNVDVIFLPHTEGISSTLLSDVLYKLQNE